MKPTLLVLAAGMGSRYGGVKQIDKPCRDCAGRGVVEKAKKISFTIPAGVDNGKRIAIPRQGDAGENGGPAGDLIVILHVEEHPYFERDGQDLYCAVPVSFTQATLGCNISIDSIDDKKISIKIPAGTTSGKLLRVKGEGVPYSGGSGKRGDLYIKIIVQIPQHISSEQKKILQQYQDIEKPTENPKLISLSSLN